MKRIFLIGDSTCQGYGEAQYPQGGWGQMLGDFFTREVTIENRAVAGRSAKSYHEDGHLAAVLEQLRPGDIALIQFGINDGAKDKPERFLAPEDFEALIRETYLAEIQRRGAEAVLLTPLPTADWNMEVRNFYDDREIYAQRLRSIAEENRLELIDAYRLTAEAWSNMPREEIFSHYMVCRPGESRQHPEGTDDRTHLKIKGARRIAALIAGEIQRRNIAGLGGFVTVPKGRKTMDKTDFSRPLDIRAVRITDDFWGGEQELVRTEVIPYQWEALNDRVPGADPSFCMRNFRTAGRLVREAREHRDFVPPVYSFRGFNALPEEGKEPEPDKFYGFVFQDSDFAKWIEAVGYSLAIHPDAELERTADEAIDIVCAAQAENGYLDTYYIINGMDRIFTNLRDHHELYCFGHLTEGAISYYQATGKDKLLRAAERYADFICSQFGPEEGKSKGYPGHEIAEMALLRLYELTGEERYLRLGSFFLDQRGTQPYYFDEEQRRLAQLEGRPEPVFHPGMRYQYHQAHLPVREQSEAVGHAVRAVYLYSGMADAARLNGDEAMYAACRRLWDEITREKLYVTGGIGGTHMGEAFSFPYDLPNDTAYSETCAAIGLVFFARRMLELHADSRYGDVMEQALYNTVLAGMALDGRSFFYVNPLEVWPEASRRDDRKAHVKASRQKWFGCACCPPNIARLVSSLGQYIVTENAARNTLYWHLYVGGTVETAAGGGMTLEMESAFPWDGQVSVRVVKRDMPGQPVTLAFRMPGWCGSPDLTVGLTDATRETLNSLTDEKKRRSEYLRDGYQYLTVDWHEGDMIRMEFTMEVRVLRADTRVREDIGKVAFARGPLVYCMEEADNGKNLHLCLADGKALETAAVTGAADGPTAVWNPQGIRTGSTVIRTGSREYTITTLLVPGVRERADEQNAGANGLYHACRRPVCDPVTLTMIPYYAWNNRGEGEMQVWVRYRQSSD